MSFYNKKILYAIPVLAAALLFYIYYQNKLSRSESIANLIIHGAAGKTPFERGFAYEKAGIWDLAVREYEKAFGPGSKTDSKEILDKLLEDVYRKTGVKGNDPEKRGLTLERAGAIELAKREYEKLFQPPVYHYSTDIFNRLLRCYDKLGDYEKKAITEGMIKKEFSPSNRIDADFGGKLVLSGYDIDRSEVRRGEGVSITYYWKASKKMSRNYAVFVHFIQGDRIFFQNDHYPLDGKFMTSQWHGDEVIRESYRISILGDIPPGEYKIRLGVWDPDKTKKRLKVKDGKTAEKRDSIIIGTLRVD